MILIGLNRIHYMIVCNVFHGLSVINNYYVYVPIENIFNLHNLV